MPTAHCSFASQGASLASSTTPTPRPASLTDGSPGDDGSGGVVGLVVSELVQPHRRPNARAQRAKVLTQLLRTPGLDEILIARAGMSIEDLRYDLEVHASASMKYRVMRVAIPCLSLLLACRGGPDVDHGGSDVDTGGSDGAPDGASRGAPVVDAGELLETVDESQLGPPCDDVDHACDQGTCTRFSIGLRCSTGNACDAVSCPPGRTCVIKKSVPPQAGCFNRE